ncbi:4-(cytidine 5'-diphospho)-2-C-methyl-D-erythritol kinase [Kiloniella sp.]|uniref:4-(cytidine 5'-diphospho)-2-C-methyl-D-erythritol kinase n=1 Tax=Kiloniella sp. TaxID=1938587 RepID=UPI003B026AA6
MERITEHAPAKINLTLQVTGRRNDGYHLLRSLVGFGEVGDVIHFTPSDEFSLHVSGPFAKELENANPENNLVLRAARSLAHLCGVERGAELHLTKNLPVASGIGGGSADAAATLRGLARLWAIKDLADEKYQDLALSLGADVPVCLDSKCAWMEGIGDQLSVGPSLPILHGVLLNPGVAVSTPDIFNRLKGRFSSKIHQPSGFSSLDDFRAYLTLAGNDLQKPACELEPVITAALGQLQVQGSCVYSGMSGSGATCFGLFDSAEHAETAAAAIKLEHPDWWVVPTAINSKH